MRAAILYARELGWRVVPLHSVKPDGSCTCSKGAECRTQGKHPRLNDWTAEASDDAGQVDQWVKTWPDANVGVATGRASGFFALDVDPDKGGDVSLAALIAEHGPLPETAQAQTGSGGSHYLFRLPAFDVTNSAGKVGRGLDIRGDGGQIVVAPSRSAKGLYRWIRNPLTGAEIAEAPAWLLARMRGNASSSVQIPDSAPTDRGFFPPASPEVLEAAREALAKHGPAINGDGGGLHTVHAAAILTHDFALTDEEAWPLFVEWNETCQPPWELEGADSLRVMLGRGRKYGKLEFGCRRTLDSLAVARKMLEDWQGSGRDVMLLLADLRKLRFSDPAARELAMRETRNLTGISLRSQEMAPLLRPERQADIPVGTIEVTTRLHEVADQSAGAIAPHVFSRNGVLCEVVKAQRTYIEDLAPARIQDLMSQCAKYVRADDKGLTSTSAPERVATILSARRMHAGVRVLESITNAPIFLADGSILRERGYSEQARVFLEPTVEVDVPMEPDQGDATDSVDLFREILCDFDFASPADFSSWMAGLLTPLVKSATSNAPSPLICVSASNAGAGKTLLTKAIAQIVTGGEPEIRPYNPKDPSEWGKRLTAYVKAGSPISVFDNINGAIGDEGLDRLITSATWSDRQLGASEAPPLANVTTWLATGNNIEPVGDTVRRVLMVRIEVTTERPQERTGFKYSLDGDYCLDHRSELLSAALTILRAYHVAGRPDMRLPSWGSFTTWSTLVRNALVWAGCADPFQTQKRAASELNEPENDAHDFWLSVVEASDGSPKGVTDTANKADALTVLGLRESVQAVFLKRFLGRFVDKPRAGRRIRKGTDASGRTLYRVETIA